MIAPLQVEVGFAGSYGGLDCAFQRKGIFALEQTNAGIYGHVTAKRKSGDAECVMFRAVCGESYGRGSMLGRRR